MFANHDRVRLKRTPFEQFCYILNGGCKNEARTERSASTRSRGEKDRVIILGAV